MTTHVHHLTGCAPVPLAHYLKALGILRVVAEQRDPNARGWWQDEHFCLMTCLDRGELERFFLETYAPTPIFNPWGARSGFYSGSSERTARLALEKVEKSDAERLEPYRNDISKIRRAVAFGGGKKPDTDEAEGELLDRLRKNVRGGGEAWLSSVVATVNDGYKKPALLGTGGNEGSGSYVSAYLNAVVVCIVDRAADHALGLFTGNEPLRNYGWNGSYGQFLPDTDASASAWDFLLMLEGAALFRSGIAQRAHGNRGIAERFLASPFYFEAHGAGAGSSSEIDEFSLQKGRRNPGRGEQWFPLWSSPLHIDELRSLLSEGRCVVGRRHAGRSIDAARAITRLGVARGITSFYRYGYLQRNNLATHYAVPLGRIDVRVHPYARLVDDIASWMQALKRLARGKGASQRLIAAERQLTDCVFAALTHDHTPDRWQAILMAASAVESIQASGTAFRAGPIPPLSPEWLAAADDGTAEWRLALALGSAAGSYDRARKPFDPVRHHWLPLQPGARRFQESEKRLAVDPRVVFTGRDAIADLGAVVDRRLIEAAQRAQRALPLVAAAGCEAQPGDLHEFLSGQLDLGRISSLARALMALRWSRVRPSHVRGIPRPGSPPEPWLAIRLACLPWPLDSERTIPADDAMVRRLRSGDGAGAVAIAVRRLGAAGIRPPIVAAYLDEPTARLWAAALAFPIGTRWARRVADQFERRNDKETQ